MRVWVTKVIGIVCCTKHVRYIPFLACSLMELCNNCPKLHTMYSKVCIVCSVKCRHWAYKGSGHFRAQLLWTGYGVDPSTVVHRKCKLANLSDQFSFFIFAHIEGWYNWISMPQRLQCSSTISPYVASRHNRRWNNKKRYTREHSKTVLIVFAFFGFTLHIAYRFPLPFCWPLPGFGSYGVKLQTSIRGKAATRRKKMTTWKWWTQKLTFLKCPAQQMGKMRKKCAEPLAGRKKERESETKCHKIYIYFVDSK